MVFNFIIIYASSIGQTLHEVYAAASGQDLGLLITFCFLWGFGTIAFGQAVQMLGMALGTAIMMSVILVVGTLLPMLVDGSIGDGSQSVSLTLVGVGLGVAGLGLSAWAGIVKEIEIRGIVTYRGQPDGTEIREREMKKLTSLELGWTSPSSSSEVLEDKERQLPVPYTTAVVMSVFGACLAVQLQFAFIFGAPLVEDAENRGITHTYSSLVVWFMAFNFQSIPNAAYACYLMHRNDTWKAYQHDTYANIARCIGVAAMWMLHVNLYGVSQALLGEGGAALAWCLVMSFSVACGQIWSIVLGEWYIATERALRFNFASMGALLSSVIVIAIAASE